MLEYMVCTMYTHDPEKKFRYMLVGASSLFLGILMFGEERERDIMFHSMISLIKGDIDRGYSNNYQDTTHQEAFCYMTSILVARTTTCGLHTSPSR